MATNKISILKALLTALLLLGSAAVRAQSTPLSDLDALRYIASYPDLIQAYGADPARAERRAIGHFLMLCVSINLRDRG